MSIAPVTTHVLDALTRLVSQFRDQPDLASFQSAFVNRIQEMEGALQELLAERSLDSAVGVQLDGLGALVGQAREGRDDSDYRLVIRARIALNIGSGTPEDIYRVLVLLLLALDGQVPHLEEFPPASILVTISGSITTELATEIAAILAEARAACVQAQLIYSGDDADTFFFSTDDTEQASAAQGWADDAQTVGGNFADVFTA